MIVSYNAAMNQVKGLKVAVTKKVNELETL